MFSHVRKLLLTGLLVLVTAGCTGGQPIEDFQEPEKGLRIWNKSFERNVRSTDAADVSSSHCLIVNSSVTWAPSEEAETLECPCLPIENGVVTWFYEEEECSEITELHGSTNISAAVFNAHKTFGFSSKLYCEVSSAASEEFCRAEIVTDDSGITEKGIPGGITKFLLFLFIAGMIMGTLCLVKRNKPYIQLSIRDTCGKPSGSDKVYDAYISIANGDTDRKYIERNFAGILQRKYNYQFFVDDEKILDQLEYSNRMSDVSPQCNRFIIVLTPSYMNNDWCMYCFAEGFRKLIDLQIPTLIIVSDNVVQEEMRSANRVISNIETLMIPFVQSDQEKTTSLLKIRQFLDAPIGGKTDGKPKYDLREPILLHAEDMDRRSQILRENNDDDNEERSFTFNNSPGGPEAERENEMEYDDEMAEPDEVQVNEYKTQKNFYSITGEAGNF